MDKNLAITERHLPEECYSPRPLAIEGVVQHYFSGKYAFPEDPYHLANCWELMHDLNFEREERLFALYTGPRQYASAHYMIGREGEILEMVPLTNQAYHAGKSEWHGKKSCNGFMVGIENIGEYGVEFTDKQYESNARLCAQLMTEYGFGLNMITGHEFVSPGRKKDPGPTFNWQHLHELINSYA